MSILSILKRPKKAAKKSALWDARVVSAPAPVVQRTPPKPLVVAYPFYRYPMDRAPFDRSSL